MPQYARPTADTTVGSWSPPPLHSRVAGSTPDDGATIHSPGGAACVIALSAVTPAPSAITTIRVRARRDTPDEDATVLIELLSAGAPVAAFSADALTETLTTFEFILDPAQVAAITDWSALAVRLTADTLPANAVLYGGDAVLHDTDVVVFGEVTP